MGLQFNGFKKSENKKQQTTESISTRLTDSKIIIGFVTIYLIISVILTFILLGNNNQTKNSGIYDPELAVSHIRK